MNPFKTEKVTDRITRIFGFAMGELMYVVEGDEKAVLIDTGAGIGDLRAVVDEITKKPLTVLYSHGHIDHAMGAGQFTDVPQYISFKDLDMAVDKGSVEGRKGAARGADKALGVTEADVVPMAEASAFTELTDGMTFDLGGEVVEAVALPGHTPGSFAFLMQNERILFTGDAANSFTFLFFDMCATVEEYKANLQAFLPRVAGRYDMVLASHGLGVLPKDVLEGLIALCDDILAGNTDDLPFEFMGQGPFCIAKALNERMERTDGGSGNIVYNKARIR